ncbi:peptidoglycan-binding protein [Streptomyces sp. NPDC050418]|uniref:peptidoglycan-binding protein n=1 Tax=Streptomyces sp. NPDC050418 TaxID=3365612 RepID=UPI0037B630AC
MHQWTKRGAAALATGILAVSLTACEDSDGSGGGGKPKRKASAAYVPEPFAPPGAADEIQVQAGAPKDIAKGAKGYQVKCVQWGINPFLPGKGITVDGDFGNATAKGVMHYQGRRGLKSDGVVGKRTGVRIQDDIRRLLDDARKANRTSAVKHYGEWMKNCPSRIPG